MGKNKHEAVSAKMPKKVSQQSKQKAAKIETSGETDDLVAEHT